MLVQKGAEAIEVRNAPATSLKLLYFYATSICSANFSFS